MRTIASLNHLMSWRRLAAGGIVGNRRVVVSNAYRKQNSTGKQGETT
jgi:hypothetical protein